MFAFDRLRDDNNNNGCGVAAAVHTHIKNKPINIVFLPHRNIHRIDTILEKCVEHKSFDISKFALQSTHFIYIFINIFTFAIFALLTRGVFHIDILPFQVQTHHVHFRGTLYL